jgi:hypothetical protein
VFFGRCNKVWDVLVCAWALCAWALCALSTQVDVWRPQYLTLRPPADLQSLGRCRGFCWDLLKVTFLVCLLGYFTMTCQLVMLCTVEWNAVRPFSSGGYSSGRGNTDLFLGAFATLRRAAVSFVVSVRPHGTTRLQLDGFSWNLIFEFFENLSRKFKRHWNLKSITGALREDNIHFWSYLARFFLEWEMFQTKVVEKIKTHSVSILFSSSKMHAGYLRLQTHTQNV